MAIVLAAAVVAMVVWPFDSDDAAPGAKGPPPTQLESKAERIEAKLAATPQDLALLRAAARAWVEAGSDRISQSRFAGREPDLAAVARDYRTGLKSWHGFLRRAGDEASGDLAEIAGQTYFRLAEIGSRDLAQVESDIADAAAALRIAGRQKRNLLTLSDVAIFAYYNGEFAAGEKVARVATAVVPKQNVEGVEGNFREYRERAETFRRQLRRAARELRETGNELLAEPLKAFRSTAELNQDEPTL